MRLLVIAVGRLKSGPERDLVERYRERFTDLARKLGFRGLEIHEIAESRARDAATRMADEAAAIIGPDPRRCASPSRSMSAASRSTAQPSPNSSARWRDESTANVVFVIGGADGLSPELRRKMKTVFAFGAATWPHQLVRIMLMEQIYRAATILAGHPYHRA